VKFQVNSSVEKHLFNFNSFQYRNFKNQTENWQYNYFLFLLRTNINKWIFIDTKMEIFCQLKIMIDW